MTVPIYLEFADGRTLCVGHSNLFGNSSVVEGKFSLKGWKDTPKRALINFNYDVTGGELRPKRGHRV